MSFSITRSILCLISFCTELDWSFDFNWFISAMNWSSFCFDENKNKIRNWTSRDKDFVYRKRHASIQLSYQARQHRHGNTQNVDRRNHQNNRGLLNKYARWGHRVLNQMNERRIFHQDRPWNAKATYQFCFRFGGEVKIFSTAPGWFISGETRILSAKLNSISHYFEYHSLIIFNIQVDAALTLLWSH